MSFSVRTERAIRMRLASPTLPSPGVAGVNLGIRGFPIGHINIAFGWVRGPGEFNESNAYTLPVDWAHAGPANSETCEWVRGPFTTAMEDHSDE